MKHTRHTQEKLKYGASSGQFSMLAGEKLKSLGLSSEIVDKAGLRFLAECGWEEFRSQEMVIFA